MNVIEEKVIDLHAHLSRDYTAKKYRVDELLEDMRAYPNMRRMISCLDGPVYLGNLEIEKLVKEYPDRFFGCAVINPKEDDALEEMKRCISTGKFKAVELNSLEHGYIPEITPNIDELFNLAERNNMFVKVFTGWGDHAMPNQWEYYLKRHPNTKTVFLHMGEFWDGYSCIEVAKRNRNLYLDMSGMYELSVANRAMRVIPHERFLFGSLFPNMLTKWSLEFIDAYKLNEEDRNRILYQNAEKLLSL